MYATLPVVQLKTNHSNFGSPMQMWKNKTKPPSVSCWGHSFFFSSPFSFFFCVIACTVTGECSCTRCTDKRVLPLVLSEDKFVYMRWGDIPPNEIALVHYTVLSAHDTQSTQWLSATLQAMHKHTARILSVWVHAHTNTHIMKAYKFRRWGIIIF